MPKLQKSLDFIQENFFTDIIELHAFMIDSENVNPNDICEIAEKKRSLVLGEALSNPDLLIK